MQAIPREPIQPMSWARKSEIAERADTLEARAEAKKEAEAQAEHIQIVIDYGVKENGEVRDATPDERTEFEKWSS